MGGVDALLKSLGDLTDEDPIRFIRSVMSDETRIEDWTLDGKWSGSGILEGEERPDTTGIEPGHIVYIRSWSGARDETIRGSSEVDA